MSDEKREVCEKSGIRLMQLDERLWIDDNELAKNKIKEFLKHETT